MLGDISAREILISHGFQFQRAKEEIDGHSFLTLMARHRFMWAFPVINVKRMITDTEKNSMIINWEDALWKQCYERMLADLMKAFPKMEFPSEFTPDE